MSKITTLSKINRPTQQLVRARLRELALRAKIIKTAHECGDRIVIEAILSHMDELIYWYKTHRGQNLPLGVFRDIIWERKKKA